MDVDNKTNCDICGIAMEPKESHNAEPLIKEGRCCGECNGKVLVARLQQLKNMMIDDTD